MVFASISFSVNSQSIEGKWQGKLKVMGNELRIVFNVEEDGAAYSSTLDSPDQGAFGIVVDSTSFNNPNIFFSIKRLGASYEGVLSDSGVVNGKFKQAGMEFDLSLSQEEVEVEEIVRPQDPVEPYPYNSEELTFRNEKDGITLAGTFTYPSEGHSFPAVILISGSGPQDRNEEIFNHRPFLVLSDHLTKKGIAVLRYDERGIGGSSGDFSSATTFDLARDVGAAVNYLLTRSDVDKGAIGLIGHSEGGIIAPLVASDNADVNMIVILAGTAVSGDKLLNMQRKALLEASGIPSDRIEKINEFYEPIFSIITEIEDLGKAKDSVSSYLNKELDQNPYAAAITGGMEKKQYVQTVTSQMVNPWMATFIKYDPAPVLEKVQCPVLVLIGEKDLQVPVDPNLRLIEQQLKKGGNDDVVAKELAGLNHLFQTCTTGLPNEYWQIDETFSPEAMNEISNWLVQKTTQ